MQTFAERKAALEKLGWRIRQEEEWRGEVGKDRGPVDLELFHMVLLPLTPRDWCRLCMREPEDLLVVQHNGETLYEDSEYVGGCCGTMSAVQDELNSWFRDGPWVEVRKLVEVCEAMRDHDDHDESEWRDLTPDELSEVVENHAADPEKYAAWSKIALVYHLVKDHYVPEAPTTRKVPQTPKEKVARALHAVSRISFALSWDSIVSLNESFEDTATRNAGKVLSMAKFLPAFKTIYDHFDAYVPGPYDAWAIVGVEGDDEVVAENHLGLCIYATKELAQKVFDLMAEVEEQYENPARRVNPSLKMRRCRISLENGIEFTDGGEM